MASHPVTIPITLNVSINFDAGMSTLLRRLAVDGRTMQAVVVDAMKDDPRVSERISDVVAGAMANYTVKHLGSMDV